MRFDRHAIQFQEAHITACDASWRWENTRNDPHLFNLWLITDGAGTLTRRDRVFHLRSGDCFLIPLWEYCLGEHDPAHPLTVHWAVFRYRDSAERPALSELPPLYRHIGNLSFFTQLVARAITCFMHGAPQVETDIWTHAVMLALDEEDRLLALHQPDREYYQRIREICEEIQANPGQPVSVERLAERCNVSPGHFTRLFRHVTGLTPRDFITRTRVDAAKSLLYLSDASITRIAETLGYRDVFHFSRQFHDRTGMSPSAFRRR